MASHAAMRLMPISDEEEARKISLHKKISTIPAPKKLSAYNRRVDRLPLLIEPRLSVRRVRIVRKPNVVQRVFKAFIPHFGLTFLLLLYLAFGSWVFIVIESGGEETKIKAKVDDLRQVYQKIISNAYGQCRTMQGSDLSGDKEASFRKTVQGYMAELGKVHQKHKMTQLDPDQLMQWTRDYEPKWHSRWKWSTSILHSLGVLTTTGYSYVQVFTREGQIFAIVYGLLGFPLTFITAANIGKFLSEMVTFLHQQYQRRMSGHSMKSDREASPVKKVSLASSISDIDEEFFEMPAWAILGMTFGFCCLGGLIYMWFIHEWSFVDALYFAFNAVTNVTLGDLEVKDIWFSVITVMYVIFGLAVVTMSIDLAQNQLRNLFQRIHYFGRKIRIWYGQVRASQIDEDVKEVLKIISTIRNEYPEKKNVTKTDILHYLNHRILRYRDSGAFSPDGISVLPFADDNLSGVNIESRLQTTESEDSDAEDDNSTVVTVDDESSNHDGMQCN